jgi:hypothetical protein
LAAWSALIPAFAFLEKRLLAFMGEVLNLGECGALRYTRQSPLLHGNALRRYLARLIGTTSAPCFKPSR